MKLKTITDAVLRVFFANPRTPPEKTAPVGQSLPARFAPEKVANAPEYHAVDLAKVKVEAENMGSALPPTRNLEDIVILAQSISNAVDTILRTAGSNYGLADWALLDSLSKLEKALSISQIAGQLGVSQQRAQQQIDILAEAKLLEVQVAEGGKRASTVTLTKQGRDSLAAITTLWESSLSKNEVVAKYANLDGVRLRLKKVSTMLGHLQRADLKAAPMTNAASKGLAQSPEQP